MISLHVINGRAFVWNSDDWHKLRTEYRIMGELIGSIAQHPRQHSYPGLPVSLLTEEAALLVEKGHCKLIKCDSLSQIPNDSLVQLSNETNQRLLNEQIDCIKDKRIEQISSKIDLIIEGKRKKGSTSVTNDVDTEQIIKEEIGKMPTPNMDNSLVQIPTENPWPLDTTDVNIDELIPSINTDMGKIRYAVFKDLWHRNYHITAGTKFGGDFLAYLGDPVKFHAMCVVKCLLNSTQEISLPDMVAFGRLGVSVNKIPAYAYLDDEEHVIYQTLQWHDTLC